MARSLFKGAIIFSSRSDIVGVIRAELKERGADPILTPEGVQHAIDNLAQHPRALLVVDWQIGVDKAIKVLEAVRHPLRAEIRPIFLFSPDEVEGLDGVCAEYGVLQMHSGEFTRNTIKEKLSSMERAESYDEELRDGLVIVAESRSRGDWEAAGTLLQELKGKYPHTPRISIELAENHFNAGDYDAVLELLDPICLGDQPDARALNLVGRVQLAKGLFQDASVTLQKAKIINPFNIDRLINLGEAYLNINLVKRAEQNFRSAVNHGSKDPRAVGGLGKSLLLGDKINEGLVFLKQLSGNREMASVFNAAAVLSMRSGRYVEGMKLYHVALDTITDDPPVLSKLAFNMGIGFHRYHDFYKASICFSIAVKLDDSHSKARQNLEALKRAGVCPPELSDSSEEWIKTLSEIDVIDTPKEENSEEDAT